MPRIYKRKTEAGLTPHDVMKRAVEAVQNGMTTRDAAADFGVSKSTLNRYVHKVAMSGDAKLQPNYQHKKIFSEAQERILADYLKTCSDMFYGLTTNQTRTLAYEMAIRNNVDIPKSWNDNKEAGKEWLYHFMQRHPDLSLRKPEATSLARASAFNRENVAKFFKILAETVVTAKCTAFTIYNLDESGCTTVQCPPKVLAPKGQKQVGQITSQERGELVTICCMVSANGSSLPPVFIFPRKNFKGYMMNGAPEGSLGLVSSNGWMNSDVFPKAMEHFISFARPSKENQVILIMDNHQSHLSLPALELAKKNFVHVITLPPHTSNKTQPLDRTVFGPMKTHFNSAANGFMLQNPGKNITIYDMASLMNSAWTRAATPENIMSGFRVSGIWPLNELIFADHEFLPSAVTDRPLQEQNTSTSAPTTPAAALNTSASNIPTASTTSEATTSAAALNTSASNIPAASTTCEAGTSAAALNASASNIPAASTTCETTTSAAALNTSAPATPAVVPTTCEAGTSAAALNTSASNIPAASTTCEATTSTPTASAAALNTSAPATPAAVPTTCEAGTSAAAPNTAESNIVSPAIFRGYPKCCDIQYKWSEETTQKRRATNQINIVTLTLTCRSWERLCLSNMVRFKHEKAM